jgi:hypothetical protein
VMVSTIARYSLKYHKIDYLYMKKSLRFAKSVINNQGLSRKVSSTGGRRMTLKQILQIGAWSSPLWWVVEIKRAVRIAPIGHPLIRYFLSPTRRKRRRGGGACCMGATVSASRSSAPGCIVSSGQITRSSVCLGMNARASCR